MTFILTFLFSSIAFTFEPVRSKESITGQIINGNVATEFEVFRFVHQPMPRQRDQVRLPAVQARAPGPASADGREQEKITFVDVAAAVYLVQQQRD